MRQLRFKADDGSKFSDWKEKKFDALYYKNNEKNVNLEFDSSKTISIASMQFNEKGNGASEDSISSYKVLRVGDIAFEGHENKEFSHGRFVLNDIGDGIMSPRFSCMRPVCKQVYGFWKYYIHSEKVMRKILVRSTKKGTMMHELVVSDFLKQTIDVPSLPEQQKIADFLSTIDTVIEKQKATVEVWEERKKGVMQKLFSQNVRFKADDGSEFPDWEEKKVANLFSKIKEKNKDGKIQNVITNSAEFGLINQRDFFDKDIAVEGKKENYTIIKTGDFVYNPRKSKQAPYGPFNCYQLEEDGIVSPLYTCLRPKGIVNAYYLFWYFQSGAWYRFIYENGAQNGARHDRVGMTDSLMQDIPVYIPRSLEEQQKIADCLSSLDDVIKMQKATLTAWKEMKKGLLQQMFV